MSDTYKSPFAPNIKQHLPKQRKGSKSSYVSPFAPGITQHIPGSVPVQQPKPEAPKVTPEGAAAEIQTSPEVLNEQTANMLALGFKDADAQYAIGRLASDYGLTPEGLIDPTNPFSRAALLAENYKRTSRGTRNSYGAAGQLYSGAYQRMNNEAGRQYGISSSRLASDFADAQRGIVMPLLAAYNTAGVSEPPEWLKAILARLKPPTSSSGGGS